MDVIDAAYHTVHNYPGGAGALAERLGKNYTTLCHEVRPPAKSAAKLGIMDAVALIEMSDNWAIVNAMMARLNGIAFRLPQQAQDDSEGGQRLALLAQDFAQLMGEIAKSSADGVITLNEYQRIGAAWAELVGEGQRMLAHFEQQVPAATKRGRRA